MGSPISTESELEPEQSGRIGRLFGPLGGGDTKGLAGDTAWSLANDISMLIVTTLSFLVIGRQLGPETYGGYIAVYGIIGPIGSLTMTGVCLAVIQRAIRERDDVTIVARSAITLSGLLGSAGVVVATLISMQVTKGAIPTASIVMLAASELLFSATAAVCISAVQSAHGFARSAKYRIVLAPGKLVMLAVLVILGDITVPMVAVGSVALYGAFALYAVFWVMPRCRIGSLPGRPTSDMTRTSLLLGFPVSAASIQSDGDKSVLTHFGFTRDAGLYGAATKVIQLGLVPLRALDSAAFQRFVHFDPEARGQHVRRAKIYCVAALAMNLLLAGFLYLTAPYFHYVLGEEFRDSAHIIRWLLIYLPFLAISGAPLNGLLGLGKVTYRAVISVISALLSLTLYIVFIPTLSWKGAIVGTVAGEAFLALVGWIVLYRVQSAHDASLR